MWPPVVGSRSGKVPSVRWWTVIAPLTLAVCGATFMGISTDRSLIFGQLVPREAGGTSGSRPRLVVTGYGRANAPAETAAIQVLFIGNDRAYIPPIEFRSDLDPVSPGEVPAAVPIIDALVAAGIRRGDVRVIPNAVIGDSAPFGPTTVAPFRLDMTVQAPTLEQMNLLIAAVHDAGRAEGLLLSSVGVRYRIGNCLALRHEARRLAMADGEERAIQHAEIAEAELATLMAVADLGPPAGAACGVAQARDEPPPSSSRGGITLPAFDPTSPAEAAVEVQLMLTYEIRRR